MVARPKVLMKEENGQKLEPFEMAVLDIPDYGGYGGDIVWIDDEFIGIEFHENHKTMVKLITGQSVVTAA